MDRFVLCPACKSKNRIPEGRAGEKAKCGKCGSALPEENPEAASSPPLILRCPACGGKNRVPVEKLKTGASCGKCHMPLQTEEVMTAWAIPITDANFESRVLESPLPVLLEFVSASCGACNVSRPVINQLASEWRGRVRVGRTDVMTNRVIADRHQIMSTPTSLIFDRGRRVDTIVGAAPKEMILQKMAPYLYS